MLAQTTGLFFNNPGTTDGYVLFSPNTSKTTYLMDKDGVVVNQWTSAYSPGLLGYLQPDGSLIRDASPHGQGGNGFINAAGAGGLIERFNWAGTKTWEFAYDSPTYLAHHDFEVMPNGNLLLIAWELRSEAEATTAGRDPNLPGAGYLYPDQIVEVQPDLINGGGTIVWQWRVWDHLVQEFDPTKSNWYGATGVDDHPELIDINYVSTFDDGGGQAEDWTHANGIDYNADLDQIVLSSREFSEFWIIDHSTTTAEAAGHTGGNSGKGGDLLYRWGNPQAYDRGTPADRMLYYQHDPQWIPAGMPGAGNITVLNNGFGRPGTDFTQVDEIATPVDLNGNYPALLPGEPHGPAVTAWTYAAPLDDFSAIISGAQRLPTGNTLIDFGVDGTFTEVTPSGQVVWKYVNPYTGGGTLGPETPIPSLNLPQPGLDALRVNFTFQAIQYPRSYVTQLPSEVVDRKLFYKGSSKWNVTNNNLPGYSDDNAIAPDKTAYIANGAAATFANVSSYTRGINGLMVDIGGFHGTITANDFIFKVGNNNSPSTWGTAPAPTLVTTRSGAGTGGTDRVELIWADGAIQQQWLGVIVKGNDTLGGSNTNTGLAASDKFFWGSAPADSGAGDVSGFLVNATDETSARNDPHSVTNPATITNVNDFDRNGQVNATDQGAARIYGTSVVTQLKFLTVGAGGPFRPESIPAPIADAQAVGDMGIATALAAATRPSRAPAVAPVAASFVDPKPPAPRSTLVDAHFADAFDGPDRSRSRVSAGQDDRDDDLLDLLSL